MDDVVRSPEDSAAFLTGGGEVGALVRERDWSATPLGPLGAWPASLRTATALVLRSPVPMVMLWGEDGVMIYNDAYSRFAGGRHPELLGSPVREGWPEVAEFNDHVMRVGLAGGTLAYKDQELTLHRHGRPEPVWMNLDYSPVPGENGQPAGVLAVVVETTERVAAERRQSFLVALGDALRNVADTVAATALTAERLGRHLGAGRAGYGEIDPAGEVVSVARDWSDGVMGSLAGEARILDAFGPEIIAELRAGRTLVVEDCRADPRTRDPAHLATWDSIGARALIVAPLLSATRLVAILYAHAAAPRQWSALEASLVEDVAERTWAAVQRARAEAAQRESEARYRQIVEGAEDFAIITTDGQGITTSWNSGAERITGFCEADVVGQPCAVLFTPEDRAAGVPDHELSRAQASGRAVDERWHLKRDGSRFWGSGLTMRLDQPGGGFLKIFRDRTAEHEAEAAVRRSEERLRAVVLASPFPTMLHAEDGEVLELSRKWTELTGYGREQIRTHFDWARLAYPEGEAEFRDRIADEFASDGEAAAGTSAIRAKDGSTRVWDVHSVGLGRLPDGRRLRVSAAADVTERQAVERRLRASEARFQAVADSIDQMIWSTRPDGFHDYYNQRWYDYTGVPEGSTDGEAWNGMFHPDDQARAWAVWRRSLETGEPYHIEYRLRHRSGRYRWVIGRAQCVRDERGRILRWYGTCTDIEEIVAAREVLARSREELERRVEEALAERKLWADVFESSDALIGALDRDHRFLAINTAYADEFERIFGRRPEVGDSLPELLAGLPEHREAALAIWDRALSGEEFTITEEFGDPDRARPSYELRFNPLRDEAGQVIGAFQYAVDVSERLHDQARLAQAEQQLRQSQKMEAVGQLTGGIAHDFNNMLAVVVGSLDLLGRRIGAGDARAKRYVDAAMDGAQRAALLTQRLLAFSRQQPLRPEAVDANKLVAGMSDLLRRSLGTDVRLETVLAGGLWRTHADPNQLENVILNLAVNARDAMPGGGRLTVETQNAHLDSRYAAGHPGVTPGQYVLLAVTDTGTGMSKEVIAKAFDPFFTTKEVGRGTGLGLSQVYGFVKQSGGHVKIYSEPGQGTTVKVYLPRHLGADGEAADEGEPGEVPLGGPQEVVLVVEDEPAVRRFSVEALAELGYRVLEADGGPEALRLLDAHPEVALLFTDVVMPEVNGAKLAQEARRRRPDLRVLFTTGYTRDAVIHNGTLDPGVEMVGKPFTLEELAAKVRAVLDAPVAPPAG